MKHIILILVLHLLAFSAAQAGAIDITLDSPILSGPPGSVLQFFGTLTNTTGDIAYLNADNFSTVLPDPGVIDDSPFFTNAPLFLLANEATSDIGLFNITISYSFAPGNYDGAFTLLGGAAADSQDILGSADFTVGVTEAPPETGEVPEPSTFWLSLCGLLTAGCCASRRGCSLPLFTKTARGAGL